MVRLTTFLCRVPVIKFRKGGGGTSQAAPVAAPRAGSCAIGAAPAPQAQPAAAMSTGGAIPDIDLPARYRRQPLSQEEIDHINGGGIHDLIKEKPKDIPKTLGIIRVPKGVLVESGSNKKEVISLNIVLQKSVNKKK